MGRGCHATISLSMYKWPGTREGYSGKQCFRADFIDFQLKLDDEIMQLLAEFDKNLKHYFISFAHFTTSHAKKIVRD